MEGDVSDRAMMARCIELSKTSAAMGELPFGSLVAHHGEIVAWATNEVMRLRDESRHAEILAITQARQLLGDKALSDCTIYCTVEPCPMCAFCIRAARIKRVVFALNSPLMGGRSRWNILGDDRSPLLFGPAPEVLPGILADDAFQAWREWRPFVANAALWFGFLGMPKPAADIPRRSYHRYSLGWLIEMTAKRRLVARDWPGDVA